MEAVAAAAGSVVVVAVADAEAMSAAREMAGVAVAEHWAVAAGESVVRAARGEVVAASRCGNHTREAYVRRRLRHGEHSRQCRWTGTRGTHCLQGTRSGSASTRRESCSGAEGSSCRKRDHWDPINMKVHRARVPQLGA